MLIRVKSCNLADVKRESQYETHIIFITSGVGSRWPSGGTAFENLHDMLLSDVAMDVSSEIAALQGMLAQDGLTQNEPLR